MKKLRKDLLAKAQTLKEKIKERKNRKVPEARIQPDKQRLFELLEKAEELKHQRCINYLQRDTQLNICALSRKIKRAKVTHPE